MRKKGIRSGMKAIRVRRGSFAGNNPARSWKYCQRPFNSDGSVIREPNRIINEDKGKLLRTETTTEYRGDTFTVVTVRVYENVTERSVRLSRIVQPTIGLWRQREKQ